MALLIVGLILFVLLVILHEYGHFIVAKRNGVEVEEFGVGFPPKLYGKKLGKGIFEGYYTVNLLPLGGFVRLKGEHDADTAKGSFGAASTSAKLRIMLAGVLVNFVTALLLFTVIAWLGMPQVIDNQFTVASDTKTIRSDVYASDPAKGTWLTGLGIEGGDVIRSINSEKVNTPEELNAMLDKFAGQEVGVAVVRGNAETVKTGKITPGIEILSVESGSPAEQAGIKSGDVIRRVHETAIYSQDSLSKATLQNAGQKTAIVLYRDGQLKTVRADLRPVSETKNSDGSQKQGILGVSSAGYGSYVLQRSTWSAPLVAVGLSAQFTWLTVKGIATALSNLIMAGFHAITGNTGEAKQEASAAGQNVSGPVGIFAILQQGGQLGYQFTLFVIAIISLTLAIMNFLPIPALDGGRAFVMLLFRAMKKPLLPATEEKIHGTGFAILMILFVVITVVDVRRFF